MNGNLQCLNSGTGDNLHCDTGIQIFGCLEFTHLAVQINSFSTDVWGEFGAFIG